MTYLLDTSVCIAYLNGRQSRLVRRFEQASPDDFRLSAVVKAELLYGARNSKRVSENLDRLGRFFDAFDSIPFDDAAAQNYAVLRVQLQRAGTPIGGNDMMIAATALANALTVVTRNEEEFVRVAGLAVERW